MKELTVGIGGFGVIGEAVARRLDVGIPGLRLSAVSARRTERAGNRMSDMSVPVPVVSLSELSAYAEVIVECAPASAFMDVAGPAVDGGKIFIPLSCGMLLRHEGLPDRAAKSGARIIVPTGALLGLDAVRAASEGDLRSVRMVTRKPPNGLKGAPHLAKNDINVDDLKEPLLVFEGTARDAAAGFPANVNVAAALSLAGLGADKTMIEIWADPTVTRNTHNIKVDSDATRFDMTIEGVPSLENPATGMLTPLSVIATLRGLVSPMRVGT